MSFYLTPKFSLASRSLVKPKWNLSFWTCLKFQTTRISELLAGVARQHRVGELHQLVRHRHRRQGHTGEK